VIAVKVKHKQDQALQWPLWPFLPLGFAIVLSDRIGSILKRIFAGAGQDLDKHRSEQIMLSILNNGYGHWHSVKTQEVINAAEEPIPWYTYPAIEFLDQFDFKNLSVFEWGAGNSSLYWAKVAKSVTSVEDDAEWYRKVKKNKSQNLTVMLIQDKEEYINAIKLAQRKYDIIIIDGSHRYECSHIAPEFLENGGFIILDNADWLPKSAEVLRDADLLQVDMSGFGPITQYTFTTSLFLHRNIEMKRKGNQQPRPSIGSIPIPKQFLHQEPR